MAIVVVGRGASRSDSLHFNDFIRLFSFIIITRSIVLVLQLTQKRRKQVFFALCLINGANSVDSAPADCLLDPLCISPRIALNEGEKFFVFTDEICCASPPPNTNLSSIQLSLMHTKNVFFSRILMRPGSIKGQLYRIGHNASPGLL